MSLSPFKRVIVAGASGTIGGPITSTLLASRLFTVGVLTRPDSKATFPEGVTIRRADLASHVELVEALKGQDVLICTLNDAAAELQPTLIEAAYEAGVKRIFQNEWAAHELNVEGTPLEEARAGKIAIVQLLNNKSKLALDEGKEFYWTGINNGTFFDWALHANFLGVSLPPTKTATIWDRGNIPTTLTNLSTVAKAVLAALTTAEIATRNSLVNISSFTATQLEIVAALEKATGDKWALKHTTSQEQLKIAGAALENGDFLGALYGWIKTGIWSGTAELKDTERWNEELNLGQETLEDIVGKVVQGEQV